MRPRTLLFGFLGVALTLFAEPSSKLLLGDFTSGWEKDWETRLLSKRNNQFHVVTDNGNKVLRVDSAQSASGIFREIKQTPIERGKISWRWKVKSSLELNNKERMKAGDDYAARCSCYLKQVFFVGEFQPFVTYGQAMKELAVYSRVLIQVRFA